MGQAIPFIESILSAYRLYEPSQGPMPPGAMSEIFTGRNGGYWWLNGRGPDMEVVLMLLQRYAADWRHYDPNMDPVLALGQLLDQGVLTPYRIPHPRTLVELKPYTIFPKDEHTQWRIFPANAVSGRDWSVRPFHDYKKALNFLETLPIQAENLEAWGELTFSGPRAPGLPTIACRLTDHATSIPHNMVVLEEPLSARRASRPRPSEGAGEHYSAPLTPASLNLGPHDEPGHEAEEAPLAPSDPPQSLAECEQRLAQARERLKRDGYQPKYSDAELDRIAQEGDVGNERFQVRFMEERYLNDRNTPDDPLSGKMGMVMKTGTGEGTKYWSTSFDQLEDADSDPKLISEKLGLEYDPSKKYALVVTDTEKSMSLTGAKSVPATFDKVGQFANTELPDDFPKTFTKKAMTSSFQAEYARHYNAAVESGHLPDQWSQDIKKFEKYLQSTNMPHDKQKLFQKRMEMHKQIGNNQDYLGNGLTKSLNPSSSSEFGVVETLNFERKAVQLKALNDAGAITVIKDLKPL